MRVGKHAIEHIRVLYGRKHLLRPALLVYVVAPKVMYQNEGKIAVTDALDQRRLIPQARSRQLRYLKGLDKQRPALQGDHAHIFVRQDRSVSVSNDTL